MHGIAINANNSLAPYAQIIACGINDAGTTTLLAETGRDISPADLAGAGSRPPPAASWHPSSLTLSHHWQQPPDPQKRPGQKEHCCDVGA